MNKVLTGVICALCLAACTNKQEDNSESQFFPVVSFLRGQAKHIDTSLYRIVKIETIDSSSTTSYIKREEFKDYAKDFLEMPDISSGKWKDDYEETKMFDDAINNVILTYTTKEKDNEVRREDVLLEPTNTSGNSEVKTVIVNKIKSAGDSTVEKNMIWYVNKRFTIITKVQKNNQPEKIKKLEVIWNDFPDQTQM
jgi:HD superfamily phosphohydrolase